MGEQHFSTGLIVGRFDPPHLGHSFMIDVAAQRCEQLVVFVNSSTERDTAPGPLRAEWLGDLHPHVTVVELRHQLGTDFDDEDLWAKWMATFRDHWPHEIGPHAVFSSDDYVGEIARRFDAVSVVVDADRVTVPISATQIRESPRDHLHCLAPVVRAWVEANWLDHEKTQPAG
ncbi:MAG: adenylyltransferase/cytidyltransferase family protein [Actinomycetota bacterium]|jgi:HTH-type transcriptional regulator, transcriptional repressor of NAD biosynthesis genes|uniref:adenylyltransferase/cytidyltransferase family protein n=1 Tax=uncultured Ilumatobacter sp. TaxID=879968 RepID=UPI00374EB0B5|nr:adenylyltransferase/cytidyltransferase family protein [Actinomycetota bacterium]